MKKQRSFAKITLNFILDTYNMKLVIISPETFIRNESKTVNQLFDHGLEVFHVRKPNADIKSIRKFIQSIDPFFHHRLIVHGDCNLLQEFNLAGIHLKAGEFEVLKEQRGVISSSAHSIAEFIAMDRPWTQIFISPVFDSISKTGYRKAPHLLEMGSITRQGQLIALGGISDRNIGLIKRKGFDGAGLLGYIWLTTNPLSNYINLKHLVDERTYESN